MFAVVLRVKDVLGRKRDKWLPQARTLTEARDARRRFRNDLEGGYSPTGPG